MKNFYKNPSIVFFIAFFIVVVGLRQFMSLPISLYPETSKPLIKAQISYLNMGAEEFKKKYGTKIESSLAALENVELVEAHYNARSARWEIEFAWDKEEEQAATEVKTVLNQTAAILPKDWPGFWVFFNSNSSTDIYVAVSSSKYSQDYLYDLLEDRVLTQLEMIDGIDSPRIYKRYEEFVKIELKKDLMEARGVHPKQIQEALLEKEFDKNIGVYHSERNSFQLLIPRKDKNLEDIRKTLIIKEGGRNYHLEDFATVSFAKKKYESVLKANGKQALLIHASVKPDGNISAVSQKVVSILNNIPKTIDQEIEITVLTDPSKFIEQALSNIVIAILVGVLIATTVIFLFLNSFTYTLIIAFSIPLSLIGGFILMKLIRIEVNLISLGAMALAVGMVVDGAIVVLENSARHLLEKKPKTLSEKITAIITSVSEVRKPIMASLLTTIIVFAPLSFTAPLANAILGDLAKVIVCVLVISVLVTLYLVPPLITYIKAEDPDALSKRKYWLSEKFLLLINWLKKQYLRSLGMFLRSPRRSFLLLISFPFLLLLSIWLMTTQIEKEIIATPNSDKLFLGYNFKEGELSIEKASDIVENNIEAVIQKDYSQYFKNYMTRINKGNGNFLFVLKNKSDLKKVRKLIEDRFQDSPMFDFYVWGWNPTALRIPREELFNIQVTGDSVLDKRRNLTLVHEGIKNSALGRRMLWPEIGKQKIYEIKLDHEKISRLEQELKPQLSNDIASLINFHSDRKYVKNLDLDGKEYPIYMEYQDSENKDFNKLSNIMFKLGKYYYPLRNFAIPSFKEEQGGYYHENGRELFRTKIYTKYSYEGDREALKEEILASLKTNPSVDMRKLVFYETGIEVKESLWSLLNALGLAILLIVLVLVLQFGSFKQCAVIMLAIPLGVIGVAFSLYLFGSTLSINSMLGIILLSGTAVNNSIIFVDFFNRIFKSNCRDQLQKALLQTAELRLQPILITTLTTILGMLPIALAFGSGGEVLQPLGIAVCGGLGLSTFLTLYVIPVVLYKLEGRKCV